MNSLNFLLYENVFIYPILERHDGLQIGRQAFFQHLTEAKLPSGFHISSEKGAVGSHPSLVCSVLLFYGYF
jgi:hypothetical protein